MHMNEDAKIPPSVQRLGKKVIAWHIPEYDQHERGTWWYIIFSSITGGLLVYALFDGNFLFALIILLFVFIIFTHHRNDPINVDFVIYERGVQIGDRYLLFRELESFAILYEPPVVKKLYITPRAQFIRKEVGIPLLDIDPIYVRSLLGSVVKEDIERERESGSEIINRVFKL